MTDERVGPEPTRVKPMTHWDPPEVLAYKNRKILAERLGWPDGHLEQAEQLDAEYPHWSFFWTAGNDLPGWERPAGWLATRRPDRHYGERTEFHTDLPELLRVVKSYPPYEPRPWER